MDDLKRVGETPKVRDMMKMTPELRAALIDSKNKGYLTCAAAVEWLKQLPRVPFNVRPSKGPTNG